MGVRLFHLLGPVQVRVDDAELPLGGPKQRLALSLLATSANHVVSTTHLVSALWPNRPPADPRASLRVHLSNLRAALDPAEASIDHQGRGYVLAVDAGRIDLNQFVALVDQGTPLVDSDPTRAATLLRDALGLWRGPAFGDLNDEPALAADVARCDELRLRAIEARVEADLTLGDHDRLVPELRELVTSHPLRERLRAQLMLALYRTGRQAEALTAFDDARRLLADELGVDPTRTLQELHARILHHDPSLDTPRGRPAGNTTTASRPSETATDARNPYKGLRAFSEADADDFFGRTELTERLVDRLCGERFLAVVGPSGSGKSSVVRAGVLPVLRRGVQPGTEHWLAATMTPGEWPMAALERTLAELPGAHPSNVADDLATHGLDATARTVLADRDGDLVLVVDQFEEVFSVAREPDRRAFLEQLRTAVSATGSRIRIVVTVRADFYDHLLVHPRLGPLVAERTVAVPALSPQQLQRAVAQPARRVGVELQPDLLATIVDDVADEPGALPLVQYAMTELFDRRTADTLSLAEYLEIGGVRGALAGRAESLYAALDASAREVCRQVFLRLVSIGDNGEETKRRVLRSEVLAAAAADTVDRVLESFGAHRLLTFDRDPFSRNPTVEIAHEALTHRWGRLRGWIDGAREDVVMHRRLLAATDEWRLADHDPGYLLRDPKLREFEEWATTSTLRLTDNERRYLDAGIEARSARHAEEAARRDREQRLEQRSVRRTRALALALAVGIVATSALSVFAVHQRDEARRQQQAADVQRAAALEQQRVATARELAAAALGQLDEDPQRSLLLAIEAAETTRRAGDAVLPEVEAALHEAVRRSLVEEMIPIGGGVAVSPDGHLAVTGTDGVLEVRDRTGSMLLSRHDRAASPLSLPGDHAPSTFLERTDDVDFDPTGQRLVSSTEDFTAQIIELSTGAVVVELDRPAIRPQFAPDGQTIAAVLVQESTDALWDSGRTLGLWDAESGALIRTLEGHTSSIDDHAFSPDGTHIATVAPMTDSIKVWDTSTGQELAATDRPRVKAVAFSPDGRRLVTGAGDGGAEIRDASTLELQQSLDGHEGDVFAVAFGPDGTRAVVAGSGAEIFDVTTGDIDLSLEGHQFVIADVAFDESGQQLITSSEDGTTRIWDVAFSGGREVVTLPGPPSPARGALAFAPHSGILAAASPDGIVLWDSVTWQRSGRLSTDRLAVGEIAFSADGTLVAASVFSPPPGPGTQGRVVIWDVSTGDPVLDVGGHGGQIWDLDFSPDGRWIATATDNEGMARVIDVATGDIRSSYVLEEGSVSSVEFTTDGSRLFVGGQDAGYIIDPSTGAELLSLGADETILDDRLLPEGQLLTGDIAGRVQVWDVEAGTVLETLLTERQGVWAVDAGAGFVAAAAPPGVAMIDQQTGGPRFDLITGHDGPVTDLAFSPDGHHLVTAGDDGTVRVFLTDVEDLLGLARERLVRSFTAEECHDYLHLDECPDR